MKIPFQCKIEECVSVDETRPAINQILLEKTSDTTGWLISTDGRRMAIIPVDTTAADIAGGLPTRAIKLARQLESERVREFNQDCADEADTDEVPGRTSGRPLELTCGETAISLTASDITVTRSKIEFPDHKKVIAEVKPPKLRVALNAELLAGIQRAIGSQAVVLEISDHLEMMKVCHCTYGDPIVGAFGLLMPVKQDGTGWLGDEPTPEKKPELPAYLSENELLALAKKTVMHVLRAICDDPRKYYLMGTLTGSYDLLVESWAAFNGMTKEEVEKIAQPDRDKYEAYLKELEDGK